VGPGSDDAVEVVHRRVQDPESTENQAFALGTRRRWLAARTHTTTFPPSGQVRVPAEP
jgi:hypothetical protein